MFKLNKWLIALAVLGVIILYWLIFVRPTSVGATNFNATICHHTPGNNVTLNFNNLQSYLGHLGQPHSGQTFDTNGPCPTPSPSPTVAPTPIATPVPSSTPEPTETPLPDFCPNEDGYQPYGPCYVDPTPTPEPSREPKPTSTSVPTNPSSQGLTDPSGPFGAAPAPVCEFIKHAPTVIEFKRLDADSVWVKWSPVDSFVDDYVVEYSLFQGFFMWTTVVENSTETTLNYLPDWLHIWARVAGTQNGCVGPFGEQIDP